MTNDFNKTEKRFTIDGLFMITDHQDKKVFNPLMNSKDVVEVFELLNALHEENEHYKSLFFEIVETALTDKNCKELYCKGLLRIFDESNSLNQAREQIKAFLEVEDLE